MDFNHATLHGAPARLRRRLSGVAGICGIRTRRPGRWRRSERGRLRWAAVGRGPWRLVGPQGWACSTKTLRTSGDVDAGRDGVARQAVARSPEPPGAHSSSSARPTARTTPPSTCPSAVAGFRTLPTSWPDVDPHDPGLPRRGVHLHLGNADREGVRRVRVSLAGRQVEGGLCGSPPIREPPGPRAFGRRGTRSPSRPVPRRPRPSRSPRGSSRQRRGSRLPLTKVPRLPDDDPPSGTRDESVSTRRTRSTGQPSASAVIWAHTVASP